LATDNPYVTQEYIDSLKRSSKQVKERLLYGNFDYDDDPDTLFELDDVVQIFTNDIRSDECRKNTEKYMSIDLSGKGADKTIIYIWE
jgi:hypothetical protein